MPFWDTAYDIQSNTAFVGFDADQSFVGGGFTLTWNSHRTTAIDFTNVFEAHEYITKQANFLFSSVMFDSDKGKNIHKHFHFRWLNKTLSRNELVTQPSLDYV